MKSTRFLHTLALLFCAGIITFLASCSTDADMTLSLESSDQGMKVLPIFQNSIVKSRSIDAQEYDEAEMNGTTFLPQLTGFTENSDSSDQNQTHSVHIFGLEVEGIITSDTETGTYTITYTLPEDNGEIILTLYSDNTFDYSQNIWVDFPRGSFAIMYTIDGGDIIFDKETGAYKEMKAKGSAHVYILSEDESDGSFSIPVGMNIDTFLRGTAISSYGFISISYADISSPISLETHSFDAIENAAANLTYAYAGEEVMYDTYYLPLSNYGTYFGRFTDSRSEEHSLYLTPEEFAEQTGFSFSDFGFPNAIDLFEFLGDSLDIDYVRVSATYGQGVPWTADDASSPTVYTISFTVPEDGVYIIPPENKIMNSEGERVSYNSSMELVSGETYTYQIPSEAYNNGALYDYLYRIH